MPHLPALIRAAVAALVLAVGAGMLAGCAARASAAASIQAGNGYVVVPASGGTTEAFLVIRNNGPADRLTSVRTSAGGQRVIFRVPVRAGATTMRTVTDISIPAHTMVRFSPDSPHLLITGTRPLHGGTQLTLTLAFATGGTMSVVAVVTNPATGGSSYFIN